MEDGIGALKLCAGSADDVKDRETLGHASSDTVKRGEFTDTEGGWEGE